MARQKETAVDRAERDVERGDLGSARHRLASHLPRVGYSPALLRRLGEISLGMKDPIEAGRYLLLSDAVGEEVEGAVEAFVKRGASTRIGVVGRLPRLCCLHALEAYPAVVQQRLRRWKLTSLVQCRALTLNYHRSLVGSGIIVDSGAVWFAALLVCTATVALIICLALTGWQFE